MINEPKPSIYKFPPITEAIIGVTYEGRYNEAELADLLKRFAENYPHQQRIENFNVKVEVGIGEDNKKKANTDLTQEDSYRFASPDLSEIFLILPGSIIISQLAPYPGWDVFFERFLRDWKLFKRIMGYRVVTRIGVRYINRIDVPLEGDKVDLEQYLKVIPSTPDRFGPLAAYAVQAEIFMNDLECKLTINSAAVPSPILSHASFVIDQDIAKEGNLPQRDEEIFSLIEKIRVRKNEVFESCVTDQARVLFNK